MKRIIVKGIGVYHVFNRTAYSRYILDDAERDMFVDMMRKQAAFCGIEVLCYCVLSNHFHMLVRVPSPRELDDSELLARYRHLYKDDPAPRAALRPSDLKAVLAENTDEASRVRKQLHERMHRLPVFMKELQQRFGIWYNMTHDNKGTLWSERFRSLLVQNSPSIMRIVAAYIELNPVRAGMVDRPEAFRWSSLSAALNGDKVAQAGIGTITGFSRDWERALSIYLRHIDDMDDSSRDPLRHGIGADTLEQPSAPGEWAISAGTTARALRQRIEAFTRGLVVGTAHFLKRFQASTARLFGYKPKKQEGAPILEEGQLFAYHTVARRTLE